MLEKINDIICIKGMDLNSNTYIIGDILIDPGTNLNGEYLLEQLNEVNMKISDISLIVNTHCHFDHIGGNKFFPDAKIAIGRKDAEGFNKNSPLNAGFDYGFTIEREDVDILLDEEDKIDDFKVINTPGHTPGGISLWDGVNLISGDTIFPYGAFGRLDIGGNLNDLKYSVSKLKKFDAEYLMPGHDFWVNNYSRHVQLAEEKIKRL